MGQRVLFGSDLQSELALLLPRLKAFAAALTGTAHGAEALVKATVRHVAMSAQKERGHTPLATFAYSRMHTLWSRHEQARAARGEALRAGDPRLFQVGRIDAMEAELLSAMPPQQRATLALVYGDRMSYDEVAEVFGVALATVMTRLVRGHAALLGETAHRGAFDNDGSEPHRQDRRVRAA